MGFGETTHSLSQISISSQFCGLGMSPEEGCVCCSEWEEQLSGRVLREAWGEMMPIS